MAELNVTDILSEIGVSAAAACKLLQRPLDDGVDIVPIDALVQKIGFLAGVGMGLLDTAYQDDGEVGIATMWFVNLRGE